jgi:hypothetical protein
VSIPNTVRLQVCATSPMTMAWNTSNVGMVKHPAKASNKRRNEIGRLTPGSIDGSLSATAVVQAPSMLPPSKPKITHSQATRRVIPTTDLPPKVQSREFHQR